MEPPRIPGRFRDLVRQFRSTLMDMHEHRIEGAASRDMANRLVDRWSVFISGFGPVSEGQRAITAMVFDDNLPVRQ